MNTTEEMTPEEISEEVARHRDAFWNQQLTEEDRTWLEENSPGTLWIVELRELEFEFSRSDRVFSE